MSKTKTISDEAIIAALLDHGTIRAAAGPWDYQSGPYTTA